MQESTKILLYGFLASALLIALCLYQHRSEFMIEEAQNKIILGHKVKEIDFINHNTVSQEYELENKSVNEVISQEPPTNQRVPKEVKIAKEETFTQELTFDMPKPILERGIGSPSAVTIPQPTLAQLHIDKNKKSLDNTTKVDLNLPKTDNKPLVEKNRVEDHHVSQKKPTLPKVKNSLDIDAIQTQEKISKLINHKISFYRSKAKLTSNAKKILNQTIVLLKENPPKKITVEGYTDASGKRAMNQWISLQRAKSVKNYLVKHGIPSKTIETVGFGESKLLYKNKPYNRLNRRVEIKITEK